MAYEHGIKIVEEATTLTAMTRVGNPCVVIGSALKGPSNEPVLIQSMSEFVSTFGFSGDFASYTLEEAAYVFFELYNVRPIICVNVLDLTRHKKSTTKTLSGTSNPLTLTGAIILSSVKITSGSATLTLNTDYTLEQDGLTTTLTIKNQSKVTGDSVQAVYDEADASKVAKADILGANSSGTKTGLYVLEEIYPRLSMIPGNVICPKWSTDSEVALALAAKCRLINGIFKAVALVDLPATSKNYQALYQTKTAAALQDEYLALFWPKVSLSGRSYYLSTHAAAVMSLVDAGNDDIPFESASNKNLRVDSSTLDDGTEISLGKDEATTINGWGIVTALNFGGWRLFGNRMSVYPASDDPKDAWLPVRRMFNWLGGVLAVNYWSRIDMPILKRNVEQIVDEAQRYLDALTARGAILGGKIAFLDEDNPAQELIDGRIVFRIGFAPPTPARVIEFRLTFDATYFQTLAA